MSMTEITPDDLLKQELVESLTVEQEQKLLDLVGGNFRDPDQFENWLVDLTGEELKELLDNK